MKLNYQDWVIICLFLLKFFAFFSTTFYMEYTSNRCEVIKEEIEYLEQNPHARGYIDKINLKNLINALILPSIILGIYSSYRISFKREVPAELFAMTVLILFYISLLDSLNNLIIILGTLLPTAIKAFF